MRISIHIYIYTYINRYTFIPLGSNTKHVNGPPCIWFPLWVIAILHSPVSSGWKVAVCTPSFSLTGHNSDLPVGDHAVTSMPSWLVPKNI